MNMQDQRFIFSFKRGVFCEYSQIKHIEPQLLLNDTYFKAALRFSTMQGK